MRAFAEDNITFVGSSYVNFLSHFVYNWVSLASFFPSLASQVNSNVAKYHYKIHI